jgi:hypothetical protein
MVGSSPPRSGSNPGKRQLSRPRQWLIERCQYANFGSLSFFVRSGEPDLNQPHHISRTIKLIGGANGPRPEFASADFELRQEHISLLSQLERLPDGTCVRVKVSHGLPGASIDLEEDHRAA